MAYNITQKLNDNIDAIRIALAWETGISLDVSEIQALQKYSGFGGIKAVLYPNSSREDWAKLNATNEDLKLYPKIIELHQLLREQLTDQEYKEAIQSIKNSVLTAFYTPQIVPQTLYTAFKEEGIQPQRIYEPSSGAGIFITEAVKAFPSLQNITAVEKDMLSGRVLEALSSTLPIPTKVHVTGFEQAPIDDNNQYDLIVSNIPFGNFSVYDPAYSSQLLSGKIHNYFFAKGLDKIKDCGLLAYITTDAFLNNPSNKAARVYLFGSADFVSLSVMPDNLMKDTGNTEAPSHLLIVQKNTSKKGLSEDEELLISTVSQENEFGKYHLNEYIHNHPEIITGDEIKAAKNQYGNAHQRVWQHGDINVISAKLHATISEGIQARFSKSLYQQKQELNVIEQQSNDKTFTFLQVPEYKPERTTVQLGLFDQSPSVNSNRAIAYITDQEARMVQKQSARIISTIKTTAEPGHESFVLMTAKSSSSNQYVYKLHSNVEEINVSNDWKNATALHDEIQSLSRQLQQYGYEYSYEGDKTLQETFRLEKNQLEIFTDLKPFYKEGTLVIHNDKVGTIGPPGKDNTEAIFQPFLSGQKDKGFYERYISIRDNYLELVSKEAVGEIEYAGLRAILQEDYKVFTDQYGLLNHPANRKLITNDSAFGFTVLSSLERKEGDRYMQADILTQSLVQKEEHFTTDDPLEALARSLNETGKVNISFIEAATGLTEAEVIRQLENHIYLNPQHNSWETVDQYLAGNVVEKLSVAKEQAALQPDNLQVQRSLEAITKVQPETIPFELLDFNLGERWIPTSYYNQFATDLFELNTSVSYFQSLDTFKVNTEGGNAKVLQEYAVTPKSGRTSYGTAILEHALENTTPFFTYEVKLADDRTIRLPDNEAIQLAHQKIETIRNGFITWLQELPDTEKKHLEQLYNETFNCYVLREYNGDHLTFPGLERKTLGIEDLYSSQKNAAWRIIQNRGGLIDHEVGLGKTLTMIVAAQEMKRLGLCKS